MRVDIVAEMAANLAMAGILEKVRYSMRASLFLMNQLFFFARWACLFIPSGLAYYALTPVGLFADDGQG